MLDWKIYHDDGNVRGKEDGTHYGSSFTKDVKGQRCTKLGEVNRGWILWKGGIFKIVICLR